MSIEGVVEKASQFYQTTKEFLKKEKQYAEASAFFLSTRTLDVLTSNLIISEHGNWGEVAPVTKYFMGAYGPRLGMVVEQATIGALVIFTSYYCNKKNFKKISGNNLLKGAGIASLGISAMNFFEYFGTPLLFPVLGPIDSLLGKLL